MHTTTSTRTRSTTSTFTASNAGIGATSTTARKLDTAKVLDTPELIRDTGTALTIQVTAEFRVAAGMAGLQVGSKEYQAGADQLARLQRRAQLLFRALRTLYASLGLFAATALITVIGSSLEFFGWQFGFRVTAFIAMGSGTAAVIGLGYGCALMVRETRVAVQNLALEAALVRSQYSSPKS